MSSHTSGFAVPAMMFFLFSQAASVAILLSALFSERYSLGQGGHGPKTRSAIVLDVTKRLGVCAVGQVQFARGKARNRTGREVECRPHEWASRSLARRSSNE
jgi:hypothetical protein